MKRIFTLTIFVICFVHLSLCQINISDFALKNTAQPENTQQSVVVKQVDNSSLNKTYEVGSCIKKAGYTSLSIGIAGLVAGAICTTVAHVSKSPVEGYTTDWKTAQTSDLKYITEKEYARRLGNWPERIARVETASYYLYASGAAVVVVSIPIIIAGNKIMDMGLGYSSNGVGVTANF